MPDTTHGHLTVDDTLLNWAHLRQLGGWSGILIGNGASMAVWERFGYESLYSKACSNEVDHPLSQQDGDLFDSMQTRNFEYVLGALRIAEIVNTALKSDTASIEERYQSIQGALAEAVRAVHVPWPSVSAQVLDTIRSELLKYRFVYSTNYDLLLYWAIMRKERGEGFKDYFWPGGRFDITDTEVWDKSTVVLYLHGGLHLYRLPTGEALKRKSEETRNLLELFGSQYQKDAVPLFVSEGTSRDKLASIHRSDYLSFAYAKFSNHQGNLVVFGHGLNDADAHLVDPMGRWDGKVIAISMLRDTPEKIVYRKAELQQKLPKADLRFFDAESHPLGSPSLRVRDDSD